MSVTEEAKRFEQFRLKIDLSQAEMATVLNEYNETKLNQTQISKYESGALAIPLKVVKVLHLKYKLSYSWFFHGTGRMLVKDFEKPTTVADVGTIRHNTEMLIEQYEALKRDFIKLHADFYEYKNTHP